jgi:hypothetical protein
MTGVGAGLRESNLYAVQGSGFRLPAVPVNSSVPLPTVYMGLDLSPKLAAVVSTERGATAASVLTKTAAYRAKEAGRLVKYGTEWADVKDAVQTSLMWSLMYDPELSFLAPSYVLLSLLFTPLSSFLGSFFFWFFFLSWILFA